MSLDDRVRDGLRASAETGGLDADDVLAEVQVAFARGERRRRLASRAVVVVVVLALFAGVASLVSLRASHDSSSAASDRWQSTATVRVAAAVRSIPPSPIRLGSPAALALAPATRTAALASAHLASGATVELHASLDRAGDILSLTTIAPTASESETLTRSWAVAFVKSRKAAARSQLRRQTLALQNRVTELHNELLRIDAELVRLDPGAYRSILRYNSPTSVPSATDGRSGPGVPQKTSVHELNLENERIQILSELQTAGKSAATSSISEVTPEIFATIIAETPATRIPEPHASNDNGVAIAVLIVVVVILLAGAAAAIVFRRRKRAPGQVAA